MNYLRRVFGKPIVPLLIINSALNQQKTVTLLKKLRKVDFSNAKAIGMVIEIDNHMPVQIDKIVDFMQQVKQQHKLQLFGFCHSQISPQSYYLLSSADRIYTMPSTLFQLQRGTRQFSTQQLLIKLGVQKTTIKSDQNLTGANIDLFTSANTSKYINQKFTQINNRLFGYAIANRNKNNKDKISDQEPPEIMLGQEAVSKGYVDGIGNYFQVLKRTFPECQLKHVRIKQKFSTRTLQVLIASPIIIVLFLLKVLLKYTIIMYFWMKHSAGQE